MNADEKPRARLVRDVDAGLELLARSVVGGVNIDVRLTRQFHFPTARYQNLAKPLGHVERESGLVCPAMHRTTIAAAVSRIEHDQTRIRRHVVAARSEFPRCIFGALRTHRRLVDRRRCDERGALLTRGNDAAEATAPR